MDHGASTASRSDDLVAGINHVATLTSDLDRLEQFYAEVFGAGVVRRWDGTPRHSMIRLGSSTVLHAFEPQGEDVLPDAKPMFRRGRLDHLGINAASAEAFEQLRKRLVRADASDGVVTEFPLLTSVQFVDPDGMELEVCWPRTNVLRERSEQRPRAASVRNAGVVRRFYDAWNNGSIDFDVLVAPDIVNHQPEVEPERGRHRFAQAVGGAMAAVPDSVWEIADLVSGEDRVVVRTTWSGTYRAPRFRGVPVPTPAAFSAEHIHIYRLADGKLAEHWVVRDDLAMLRQLGALKHEETSC